MKKNRMLEKIQVSGYAAGGKSFAKIDGKVIFIEGAVPGDVTDVILTRNKKDWAEGKAVRILEFSSGRAKPFCKHFGICGGCKWQMLPYELQLQYKQQEVEQNLRRIGKTELPEILPIIGSAGTIHYRNKLEFTFSNKKYISPGETRDKTITSSENALGFHAPRIFDKVINIEECYLMDDVNNQVRNTIRSFALNNNYSFYDIRNHNGWLRNIIIRHATTGEVMVNICFGYEDEPERVKLLDHLLEKVPAVTTLLWTINPKRNDAIYDLLPQIYSGKGYVTEELGKYMFKVGPKSFFQTNTRQAEKLYGIVKEFAELKGSEIVYDLYCGTGSIGIFLSDSAGKIIGVDVVEDAVNDAIENAGLNNVSNAQFFTGDVIKICDDHFFAANGKPDVIITDPPRAGMHEKLVAKLLKIASQKIVYVSCNTATQARDISLLSEKYRITKVQPVDMFPHTHHIECVILLELKEDV